jgi:hypothetical protein
MPLSFHALSVRLIEVSTEGGDKIVAYSRLNTVPLFCPEAYLIIFISQYSLLSPFSLSIYV